MKKNNLLKYLLLFLWVIFYSQELISQEIIEYKGDTMIVISPQNLNTINAIIVENEYNKIELELYQALHKVDSVLINSRDSIIHNNNLIIDKQVKFYSESIEDLSRSLEQEKIKRKTITGILGTISIVLCILAVK